MSKFVIFIFCGMVLRFINAIGLLIVLTCCLVRVGRGQTPGSASALDFNGSEYVDLGTQMNNLTLPVTVCAWVRNDANMLAGPVFSNSHDPNGYAGFWLRLNNTVAVTAYCDGSGFVANSRRTKTAPLSSAQSGTWKHNVVSLNSASDMEIYLNGVALTAAYSGSGGAYYSPGTVLPCIGRMMSDIGWRCFEGAIDEVSIWDSKLSQFAIRNIMTKSLTGGEPNLVAYYRMDAATGLACIDFYPNGYNGTLQNPNTWITSSAAIGDTSHLNYGSGGSNLTSFTTTLVSSQQIVVENISPPVEGVQVYEVTQPPNTLNGLPAAANVQNCFGVFLCRTDMTANYTYDLRIVNPVNPPSVYGRNTNSDQQWQAKTGTPNGNDWLVTGDQNRQEYWFGQVPPPPPANCDINENYSNAAYWTSDNAGNQIAINNGQLEFNSATDGVNRRVYKALNTPLTENCWTTEFEFIPIAGGVNQVAGHILLALTEGNDCPLNTCNSVNTNFTNSTESGILVNIGSPRNSLPLRLRVISKLGTAELSSPNININYGQRYYLRVERLSETQGEFSVFSDNVFQQHVAGSPVSFTIQNNLGDLNYIQHSTAPQGHPDRQLTAELDNVCIDQANCDCSLEVNLGQDILACNLNQQVLSPQVVNSNYNYTWNTGQIGPAITVNQPGTYWVEADSAGCTGSDTINLKEVDDTPGALILPLDTTLCLGDNLYLEFDNPGYTYRWPDGSVGNGDTIPGPGLLTLEVFGPCDTIQHQMSVEFIDCDCTITIPDVFTPNQDGRNELFQLTKACELNYFHIQIFNRWGVLVFESFDIKKSWRGEVNGTAAPQAVYVYRLEYHTATQTRNEQGHLTLMR
jgi:gliding motility-associated-like protein